MEKQLDILSAAVAHLRSDYTATRDSFNANAAKAIEAISEILKVLQSPLVSEAKLAELKKHFDQAYPVTGMDFHSFGEKLMEVLQSIGSATDPKKTKPEEFTADKYEVVKNGKNDFSIKNLVTGLCYKHVSLTYSRPDIVKFYQEDEAQDYCEALNVGHKLRMKKEGA